MHAREHERRPVLVLHSRSRDNHHQQQAESIDGDVPFAAGNFLARIVKDGVGWKVEDLGSSNGTWLDGERITSARLVAGGRLKIGSTEFVLNDIQIEDDSQIKFEDHGSIMTSVPAIPPGLFDELGNIRESLLEDQNEIKQIAERGGKETIEVQKLRLIGALGEAVMDVAERSAVAKEILNTINRELRADRGFVCIFQEDGTFLPLASYGVKPGEPVRFSRTVIDRMRKNVSSNCMK